jgi:hypothetical protein
LGIAVAGQSPVLPVTREFRLEVRDHR